MTRPYEYLILGVLLALGIVVPSFAMLEHTGTTFALLYSIAEILVFATAGIRIDAKLRDVSKDKATIDAEFDARVNERTQELVDMIVKLEHLSSVDYLTEVANCRQIKHLMSEELARSQRTDHQFSIIMLDIDHFKSINDKYGHPTGDLVLQTVAKVCKDTVREIDHVGRVGGEEFLIVLPETNAFDAGVIAERIRDRIEFLTIGEKGIKVTVSLGVSSSEIDSNVISLYETADTALYSAKDNGRNCVMYSLETERENSRVRGNNGNYDEVKGSIRERSKK